MSTFGDRLDALPIPVTFYIDATFSILFDFCAFVHDILECYWGDQYQTKVDHGTCCTQKPHWHPFTLVNGADPVTVEVHFRIILGEQITNHNLNVSITYSITCITLYELLVSFHGNV